MRNASMKSHEERERQIQMWANYIICTGATIRQAAKKFGIAKTTVHHNIEKNLPKISSKLYKSVRKVIEKNKKERHIRGGMATRAKYIKLKESMK